jgi:iron-regulated transmembrane protein
MKRKTWRKYHKWIGIIITFFLVMFCLSGIILNHRQSFADINVSRAILPARYSFEQWNNGLLRGTLRYNDADKHNKVIIYGAAGVIQTDSAASKFTEYNQGLPSGADYRQIRGVVKTPKNDIFAASVMGLYKLGKNSQWQPVSLPLQENDELLTDIITHGDTLIVLSRSHLYYAKTPYKTFTCLTLQSPNGYEGKVSLFRQIWLLHSGALFGTIGKLLVDGIGIILILLCVTGIWFWLRHKSTSVLVWHNKIGVYTFYITLFLAITGWALRPPLMILLAKNSTKPLPGTTLSSDNAWNDKLRMIRYDDQKHDWLISTSEGFFSLKTLADKPTAIEYAPPVSVMGQNVWQRINDNTWVVGSFDGLFLWNRDYNEVAPYDDIMAFNPSIPGTAPSEQMITGFSSDFKNKECIATYYLGSSFAKQPEEFKNKPMSLWSLALEVHTGRIYAGALGSFLFIFVAGILIIIVLVSGKKA